MCAWENINKDTEFKGSFTKIFQAISEPYAHFLEKLMNAVQRKIKGKEV